MIATNCQVKVTVRCRPLIQREIEDDQVSVLNLDSINGQIQFDQVFKFDKVFDIKSEQQDIYSQGVYGIVENTLLGNDGTIFAYGQTGTGKTYTLVGKETPDLQGIIPRSFDHIFKRIEQLSQDYQFEVQVSYFEIYNEKITNYLSQNKQINREQIPTSVVTKNQQEMREKLSLGLRNRAFSKTHLSYEPQTSHYIFQITIYKKCKHNFKETVTKLNFVDLAGSENLSRNLKNQFGDRLLEAKGQFVSLKNFVNLIKLLSENQRKGLPYQDSKLTEILQASFERSSQILIIATISPAKYRLQETINTLVFAKQANKINETQQKNICQLKLSQRSQHQCSLGCGNFHNRKQGNNFKVIQKAKSIEKNKISQVVQKKFTKTLSSEQS